MKVWLIRSPLAGYHVSSGANNTILGYQVASTTLSTGTGNILIGTSNGVDTLASGTTNFLDIGNVIFATGMTGAVGSPAGSVGIDNNAPSYPLDVTGSVRTTQAVLNSSGVPTISACGTTQ